MQKYTIATEQSRNSDLNICSVLCHVHLNRPAGLERGRKNLFSFRKCNHFFRNHTSLIITAKHKFTRLLHVPYIERIIVFVGMEKRLVTSLH
jgi:hypothetical protein